MNKKMWFFSTLLSIMLVTGLLSTVQAAPTLVSGGLGSMGEIESLKVNNDNGVYSSGVMVVGGVEMIIPKNMLIDLPANRLSLKQIFDQAPAACVALGESGLAKADKCNGSGTGGIATLHAVRTNAGNVIVGDLFIQKAAELVVGVVTYINYDQGYYRVNGLPNDPNTGAMVRLNDPTSRHTIQSGPGCTTSGPGEPNCSPDPRFCLDPDNYTNTFATGYPMCIPSTVSRTVPAPGLPGITGTSQANANGAGDLLCPDTNRSTDPNEPAVPDSRRFAPVRVGDSVSAEGNYETVGGVRFLSAHSSTVQKALSTSNAPGQPDYLFLEEVDIEAPAFQNERQIAMFIGFTTFAPTDVDIWSLQRDAVTNQAHEFPLASVQGCDVVQGGPGNCSAQGIPNGPANTNIFKVIYRDDYLKPYDPKLSPCAHLLASPRFGGTGVCAGGGSIANDFAVLSPIPHEIIARTGRKIDDVTANPPDGTLFTLDINGNPATNGEYLFPLGLNLGGIGVAEMSEIDLNLLNSPTVFEGIPWNLDRRLGPSGCLNNGGVCEAGAVGSAGFALDPFPFSGLDPRTQANGLPTGSYSNPTFSPGTLTSIRNRIFSYVTDAGIFNGDATMLPYILGTFPADPPLIPINPTPALDLYPPITDEDAVTGSIGVPGVIEVLANDIAIFGSIDPATVAIATPPASGSAVANLDGTITFTPAANGVVTFTYTVANNFGSVSLPGTVTVTVASPASGVVIIADQTSPQAIGTPITFTAAGSGGSGSYEYQFSTKTTGTNYTVDQPYSTANTWVWNPAATGPFDIQVDVRNVGSTSAGEASRNIFFYQITAASTPATGVTLVPDLASPQVVGTPVTFTAAGSGGSGTYEYRFWVNYGAGFLIARDYSTSNTFTWTPTTVGNYDIMVDVRNVGSTALRDAFEKVFFYQIQPAPATAVSVTPDKASPQAPGTPVVFTAAGSGGSGTYEYRFWLNSGAGYAVVQNYSTLPTWTWIPSVAGAYDVLVDVRSVGSTVVRDALNNVFFYQIQ
jgi:hypothetical protein